jgi:hypothetical protein
MRPRRRAGPFSELRLQLFNPSTSPNELNTTLTPHSIIHGDACFAYFNKIWGIPVRHFWKVIEPIARLPSQRSAKSSRRRNGHGKIFYTVNTVIHW